MTPDSHEYSPLELRTPSLDLLAQYAAALGTGWSPSTTRDVSGEQLAQIRHEPDAFIASLQEGASGTMKLADGQEVPRLAGMMRWIWQDGFCGQINLRYQPGTTDLPPYVSGHIGYAVVPWRQRQGVASRALRQILPIAAARGLNRVSLTCDEDNLVSRRVIEAAGGRLDAAACGPGKLLFWIELA